jgi:hypothetical protein
MRRTPLEHALLGRAELEELEAVEAERIVEQSDMVSM